MANSQYDESGFLRTIIDSFPALVMVVDEDVKILECNAATASFIGGGKQNVLLYRCGDVLGCIHSAKPSKGCGRTSSCKECIARNSVTMAFKGNSSVRRRAKMEIVRDGKKEDFYALVTATPFSYQNSNLVLLVIEDISEITELQRLVPICMKCKKIRDDSQYWMTVEEYFKRHWDMDFTHGLCPDCFISVKTEIDKMGSNQD